MKRTIIRLGILALVRLGILALVFGCGWLMWSAAQTTPRWAFASYVTAGFLIAVIEPWKTIRRRIRERRS